MSRRGPTGSFWPDARQRALLRVVLGPAEEAAARWQALQPLDVTRLPFGSFGILPLLYERLAAVAPDDPQLPLLHGTYRSTWYRNQLLLDRLGRLLPALRDRGVDALLVGGGAAVRRWYPALGSRPVSPLELIVPPDALAAVRTACLAAEWRPAGASPASARFVHAGTVPLVVHLGAPPPLAGPLGPGAGFEALRERAVELPVLEGTPLALDPADALLLLCATGASTAMRGSCQWLIDVHRLLAVELPPPEALLARARVFRVVEPLRATAVYLARTLETPWLEEYARAVAGARGNSRERLAFFLAGAPTRRLGAGARLLAAHLRASADESLFRVLGGLPRHLQETWQTASLPETLLVGFRKTARLLRPSGSRALQSQPSAAPRNRSASS